MPPTKAELQKQLNGESKRMHHNGTLLLQLPIESYGDKTDNLFWDSLNTYADLLCDSLSNLVQERFAIELTFHQYGRGGATFAPSNWVYGRNGEYYGIDGDSAIEDLMPKYCEDQTNLSEYNARRKLLEILEFINDFWENQAAHCEEWWAEEVAYLKEEACKP